MSGYRTGIAALLLACAGAHAVPAAAQVNSTITASNLRYVLTDLTPDDGVAPSVDYWEADPSPLSVSSAVMPGDGERHASNFGERRGAFQFSANTRLSLAVDVTIAMEAGFTPEQSGSVWVGFLGGASWGPPKDQWPRRDSEVEYGDVGHVFGGYRPRFDRDLTLWLTFENDSAYAAWGDYAVQLESAAHVFATPVPEAPASAMLVLGIGMLGALGRRRARARAASIRRA